LTAVPSFPSTRSMSAKRDRLIQWFSVLAGAFITLQIAFILAKGEAFCINDGCRVVEKLTIVPPLYINLAGLLYFIALFSASRSRRNGSGSSLDRLRLLLLLGLAVEAVLLSYQVFVIRAFCTYCLVIFAIIIALNLFYGWQQIRIAVPLLGAMLASFAVLNFSPASLLALKSETLASGTYAVRKCAEPAKKLYFFFSSDCPHCKNVLSVLENCNSCEFHFNPIDKNQVLAISGLEYNPSYSPSLNRVVLSMLNITTIPVLLVQNPDGLTFIKGEEGINRFVRQTCFLQEEEISIDPSLLNLSEPEMNIYDAQEGDCTIEVECPDEPGQTQGLDAQ
jgi:uncharacterized membrane protein